MESFNVENLSFTYPERAEKTLDGINIRVDSGEFVLLCGKSGCGKTTFLRLLKSSLAPYGNIEGRIYFQCKDLKDCDSKEQAAKIGFVMQSPDDQIVTDKVWHELAFGLESLGVENGEIRTRVAEIASFFGLQNKLYENVCNLSGGQKQVLNLASVMAMRPEVLILDEPTSMLDPIAAQEFLKAVEKINREIGTTVILSEHRLEEALPLADRVIVMEDGKLIADERPNKVYEVLKNKKSDMTIAMPTAVRIWGALAQGVGNCPVTVREGRKWLEDFSDGHRFNLTEQKDELSTETVVEVKDVYFRYEKNLSDIVNGLSLNIKKGEFYAIVGGNGAGKTTALSLISGLNRPYRGKVLIEGQEISQIDNLYDGIIGVLPQDPKSLFVKKTVYLDLLEILSEKKLDKAEKQSIVEDVSRLCRIESLLNSHPYDLSGGEQQRVALAKVLLCKPRILLLDEPTKGMDAHFKQEFSAILSSLKQSGVTVIMVSHDIEFCAANADRCAMFFDGSITSEGEPRRFFAGNSFYTTAANRIAGTKIPNAVLTEDIILAFGGKVEEKNKCNEVYEPSQYEEEPKKTLQKKISPVKIIGGIAIFVLFLITCGMIITDTDMLFNIKMPSNEVMQLLSVFELGISLFCFLPKRSSEQIVVQTYKSDRKLTKRTFVSLLFILISVPLTIYVGIYFLGDRKYYFISLLIILETLIPFGTVFESRKPQAREIVIISVLCAIAVAGRAAFYMLPQFKPVVAIVIISGVCFGGETGFLVGAITGFVSNFLFGQGPWTPWQMFAFGMVGLIAGILFRKGFLRKTKASLCVFGAFATLIVYGGVMNPASVIMMQTNLNQEMLISSFVMGFPFDLIHSVSTAFFLWFVAEPMIDKLERVKSKYGLIDR